MSSLPNNSLKFNEIIQLAEDQRLLIRHYIYLFSIFRLFYYYVEFSKIVFFTHRQHVGFFLPSGDCQDDERKTNLNLTKTSYYRSYFALFDSASIFLI